MRFLSVLVFLLTTFAMAESPVPKRVTVEELNARPSQYDGQFVEISAVYGIGWEGDKFLIGAGTLNRDFELEQHVWFTCSSAKPSACYGLAPGNGRGTFVGYFHFTSVYPRNVMYDPGPLQLEVTDFRFPETELIFSSLKP